MGIEGVPKPESIVTKSATNTPAASASQEAEKVAEAGEADAEDAEERSEL
jgi:FK506-binding protein 2